MRRKGMTLLARVVGDVRYTLRDDAWGGWYESGRDVRAAVVHCDDLTITTRHRAAWGVTVRLEDGERVAAHDVSARQLPAEIEHAVVELLRRARHAA